jgi:hypothetical protein
MRRPATRTKAGVTFSIADNYGFHNFEGFPENRDVGVVVLDEPYSTPSGEYGILPEVGAVDEYAAAFRRKQNVRFTSSGYGLSAQRPVVVSFPRAADGHLLLGQQHGTHHEYNLKTTANPAQGKGGTCNGDSGGPIFFYGTNVIAAVTSFGNNAVCKGLDFSYRLDREPVLDWILDPNRSTRDSPSGGCPPRA